MTAEELTTLSDLYTVLNHDTPTSKADYIMTQKLQRRKGRLATTRAISAVYPHSAYTERRGSCKMASFSDVKLKSP